MYKHRFSTVLLALSLVCAGIPAMAETQAPEYPPLNVQPEGKPSRYAFVAKLLEVSSGAKQVQASTDPEVIATYNEARKLFEQANTAADTTGINMYLNMAVGKMYSAIQASTPKKVSSDKFKQDYEQRLKSVDALSEAYQRIVQEKQAEEKGKLVMAQVAKHKSAAADLGAKDDYQAARTELDLGYNLIKSAIELLRGGDTLTRTLSFASAEEEYHYEKDRNDTHFMLVNLLVNSKLESKPQSFKDKIAQMVQEATEAQEVAESLAKKGKHKEAIAKLEESTSVLVKAIRMGGIFIPSA
ncbi:hypothetical protein [Shewanella cyperi]|uniref:hypothetical protein n=1 Tax=Shewanella cyperi TaxID=2814292 RepID=UPI001A94A5A2|nr:hypothetical protein [Shewanella cyperi]QSX41271.1 hypothetical protein JYB84_02215 [Shewanella cyperi]